MHVNIQHRFNPAIGCEGMYYRLKESYRDVRGIVHSLIVLNIGFEPQMKANQIRKIAAALSIRMKGRGERALFDTWADGLDEYERAKAGEYWTRMIGEGMLDRFDNRERQAKAEAERYIDLDTVEHTDAREVGPEWLCRQIIDQLGLPDFLRNQQWTDKEIDTALSALIVRTLYSPSEHASYRIMTDNSAACELCCGNPDWHPGINSLYAVPDKLYDLKEKLEKHLCERTDNLFNLQNRIVLFDLTNFYFEGRKAQSRKAKFGRSKEKRSDCKLLVLALCIYPSISKHYNISYVRSTANADQMGKVGWEIKDLSAMESGHGVYFLRTNVMTLDEKTTWDYYNLIREIECTNRQLKTNLNLRPIYHQKDSRSDAHLFFGLLAYWIVNTIRHQLKQKGETCFWTEIVRRMSTQKLVTTTAVNALADKVEFRQCSKPSKQASEIYRLLGMKEVPFKKIKICRTQPPEKIWQPSESQGNRHSSG